MHIFKNLLGRAEQFSMSARIFNCVTLITSLLLLGTTVINTISHLALDIIVASAVCALFFIIIYYLSRAYMIFRPLDWLASLLIIVLIAYTWIRNGGSAGATHSFLIVAPLFFLPFGQKLQKIVLTLFYCGISAGLLTLEYLRPDLIAGYVSSTDRYLDLLFATITTQLGAVFAVGFLLREFYQTTKRLELKQEKSERRFGEIADTIPAIICELKPDLTIEYLNKAGLEFTGYEEQDLCGSSSLERIVHPDDWPGVKQYAGSILDGGTVPVSEYRVVIKVGKVRNILARSAARYRDGSIDGIRVYMVDITEKKRLELQYLKAQRMESVGMLAGGIAHDFNNLLSGIMGYAELIKISVQKRLAPPFDSELNDCIEPIINASIRASELIKRLLVFTRQQPLQTTNFDMRDIMAEVKELLSRTINKNIGIHMDLSADPLLLHGDRTLLQSAIMNLCVNARDAMPDGGTLTLHCSFTASLKPEEGISSADQASNGYAVVRVADTGTGMTDEVKHHLFEPFFTTKSVGKGTGLGLASVYGTIKDHNGHIEVESEPDKGTTFTLYLPITTGVTESPEDSDAFLFSTRTPEKVLVVDDEQMIGNLIKGILITEGHQITIFTNPQEALSSIKTSGLSYTLAIVDMIMPEMNGLELIRALRGVDPKLPAILMSGYAGSGDTQSFPRDFSIVTLSKPFKSSTLFKAVEKAVAAQKVK